MEAEVRQDLEFHFTSVKTKHFSVILNPDESTAIDSIFIRWEPEDLHSINQKYEGVSTAIQFNFRPKEEQPSIYEELIALGEALKRELFEDGEE